MANKKSTSDKKKSTKKDTVNKDNKKNSTSKTVDKKTSTKKKTTASNKGTTSKRSVDKKKPTTKNKESSKTSNKKANNKKSKKKVNNKTKKQRIYGILGKIFKIFLVIFLLLLFIGILTLLYFFFKTGEVTDQNFWSSRNTTKIKDRDGELIQIHGKNIKYVTLDEISPYYLDGLIAMEDEDFYKHSGVSFKGLIRATLQTVFTSSDSGGSTITMQLAKNLYLSPQPVLIDGEQQYSENGQPLYEYPYDYKIGYKFQQMVYAWKIETQYSKDQILENYVNLLEFNGPIGIEKASEYYFGVPSKDLTLPQAAGLAGMTQLPAELDPYTNPDKFMNRRDDVLGRMLVTEKITQEQYDEAIKDNVEDSLVGKSDVLDEEYEIIKPYLDVIQSELKAEFGDDFDINEADAVVTTSLDYDLQVETYNVINNVDGNVRYESEYLQAGTTTIDNETGEILAVGGGREGVDVASEQNYGALYLRQPGSTSKPIVDYGPALEFLDWSTYHQMTDKKTNYTGGPEVENAYQAYYGDMSIQEALSRSTNTIAVQTFQAVAKEAGVDNIEKFMSDLGIEDSQNVNEAYAIGGWNNGTTPLELAGAYSAFANGGQYIEPHAVTLVEFEPTSPYYDEYGASYVPEFETNKAMQNSTAYMITKMLDPNLPTAITKEMYVPDLGPQAIKTGTSNWAENNWGIPEGAPRDKWVAGYNADVTTVIWTGYSGEYESQGYYFDSYGLWSYDIYKNIMQYIADSEKGYLNDGKFPESTDVASDKINGTTYYFKKDTDEYNKIKEYEDEAKKKEQEKKDKEKEEQEKKENNSNSNSSGDGLVPFRPGGNGNNNNGSNNNGNNNNSNNNSGGSDNNNSSVNWDV